ncbi:MAG: hypothetical protein Q9M37_03440 [Desulfonauticus sp.]|nr:hypothetical protein [Desulfonauticus sp.]
MRFDTDFEYDEWSEKKRVEQIGKDAQAFRHRKMGEIFPVPEKNPTKLEIEFVNRWAEMFKEDI